MGHTELLTEQQASERLNIKVKTLQAWRVRGGGPKFVKLGRCIRYAEHHLEEFIAQKTLTHTPPADRQQQAEALEVRTSPRSTNA